jgi:transposase
VQIVESVRVDGKVKQRIVRHVGIALDDDELEKLREVAEYVKAKMIAENDIQVNLVTPENLAKTAISSKKQNEKKKQELNQLKVDLKKLREQQRIVSGIHEVFGKVYHDLGFEKSFVNANRKAASTQNLFQCVMARLANPVSKRASVMDLSSRFGVEISLPAVYRMMDTIDDKTCDRIRHLSYQGAVDLFGADQIGVVFYDCTTLYFESFSEDELKSNGYSKDGKFNQPQVLLGLLVTKEGIPIGYEVFPGSTYEGHTLMDSLKQIQSTYQIKDVVVVADSGLLGKQNIESLEQSGFKFIMGARLKSLCKTQQDQITGTLSDYGYISEDHGSAREFTYNPKDKDSKDYRLIVSYKKSRATKDKMDRKKAIDKLLKKLSKSKNPSSLISNYGYKKFLKVKGKTEVSLDEDKIHEASKWDGLHGVITNMQGCSMGEVLSHYHSLWQIEECFRVSKHDLKIRPIFHWTPSRIRAHIAICFISLVCMRHLWYRIKLQYKNLSPESIRIALSSVQLSVLKHVETNERYGIPSCPSADAKKIYDIMGLNFSEVPYRLAD